MPAALLEALARELPYGDPKRFPRLGKLLHLQPGRTIEFKVMATCAPELERINVRRVLSETLEAYQAHLQEARAAEARGKQVKLEQRAKLLPGQLGVRTGGLKRATVVAKAALKACEKMIGELPEKVRRL